MTACLSNQIVWLLEGTLLPLKGKGACAGQCEEIPPFTAPIQPNGRRYRQPAFELKGPLCMYYTGSTALHL